MDYNKSITELTNQLKNLLIAKNTDYGDSVHKTFEKFGIISTLVRINDKLNRLERLAENKQNVQDESIIDTLMDLAGYAIMSIIELSPEEAKQEPKILAGEITTDMLRADMLKAGHINIISTVEDILCTLNNMNATTADLERLHRMIIIKLRARPHREGCISPHTKLVCNELELLTNPSLYTIGAEIVKELVKQQAYDEIGQLHDCITTNMITVSKTLK